MQTRRWFAIDAAMSTNLASAIVLAFFVMALAPLALIYWKPGATALAAVFYVLLLGIALYPPLSAPKPRFDLPTASTTGAEAGGDNESGILAAPSGSQAPQKEACNRALQVSEDAGLILSRRDPLRVIVKDSLWSQLPQQVQDALVLCLATARNTGSGAVEISKR